MALHRPWQCEGAPSRSEPDQRHPGVPDKDVAASLKRIRIHPLARRMLGESCLAIVQLQRLNFRTLSLSCLQPVVSLVRLQDHQCVSLDQGPPQQNGFSPCEIGDGSDRSQPEHAWTEPYCPDNSSSGAQEPEEDSGFDCESNCDQPYILFESESEADPELKMDTGTFYLDPDPEQDIVIELDPEIESEHDRCLELEDEQGSRCEVELLQTPDLSAPDLSTLDLCALDLSAPDLSTAAERHAPCRQPEAAAPPQHAESEDFCAVCLNGGDLLCCDICPKVFHLCCHIPPIRVLPAGDWVCSLCRTDQDVATAYESETADGCSLAKAPYTLSNRDQRRCEKLTLLLSSHVLSAPFHEPVSPLARNYYQIIKRPIDLSVIRRKLDESNTLHYFTAEQFVDDVLLMFKNCATFNYPDSEVAQAGRSLEEFFLSKLQEIFHDRKFPSASQDKTDQARLQWLRRKRRENYRRKKQTFSGKKYYL